MFQSIEDYICLPTYFLCEHFHLAVWFVQDTHFTRSMCLWRCLHKAMMFIFENTVPSYLSDMHISPFPRLKFSSLITIPATFSEKLSEILVINFSVFCVDSSLWQNAKCSSANQQIFIYTQASYTLKFHIH